MLGVEILNPDTGEPDAEAAWNIVVESLRMGLILLVSGPDANVIQWTPAFTVTGEQTEFAVESLVRLVQSRR
jgi:4-aminobutyrate aminotransferase